MEDKLEVSVGYRQGVRAVSGYGYKWITGGIRVMFQYLDCGYGDTNPYTCSKIV